jgi:hypothetical protein
MAALWAFLWQLLECLEELLGVVEILERQVSRLIRFYFVIRHFSLADH